MNYHIFLRTDSPHVNAVQTYWSEGNFSHSAELHCSGELCPTGNIGRKLIEHIQSLVEKCKSHPSAVIFASIAELSQVKSMSQMIVNFLLFHRVPVHFVHEKIIIDSMEKISLLHARPPTMTQVFLNNRIQQLQSARRNAIPAIVLQSHPRPTRISESAVIPMLRDQNPENFVARIKFFNIRQPDAIASVSLMGKESQRIAESQIYVTKFDPANESVQLEIPFLASTFKRFEKTIGYTEVRSIDVNLHVGETCIASGTLRPSAKRQGAVLSAIRHCTRNGTIEIQVFHPGNARVSEKVRERREWTFEVKKGSTQGQLEFQSLNR